MRLRFYIDSLSNFEIKVVNIETISVFLFYLVAKKSDIFDMSWLLFLIFPSFLYSICHCLPICLCIVFQVHVVDGSSPQPDLEFDAVRLELELFSPELAEKPFVVAYNKMDLPEANETWPSFKEKLQSCGITPFAMSAVKREGTHEVICAAYELLCQTKEAKEEYEGLNLIHFCS